MKIILQWITSWITIPVIISAIRISLTMDSHDGSSVYDDLVGTIVGEVSFSPGINGKALNIGQTSSYVNYGIHKTECFYRPERCDNSIGVTFAMWLNPSITQPAAITTVMYTGTEHQKSNGYAVFLENDTGNIRVEVHLGSQIYYTPFPIPQGIWSHVTFTWSRYRSVMIYINGCAKSRYTYRDMDFEDRRSYISVPFSLGASGKSPYPTCSMMLDEFKVWYMRFSADQVWQLFMQRGMIWGESSVQPT